MRLSVYLYIVCLGMAGKASSQCVEKSNLYGKWQGYKKELRTGEDGSSLTLSGKPYVFTDVLWFKKDKNGEWDMNGDVFTVKYDIACDILVINKKEFYVEKIDGKNLVLIEYAFNKEKPSDIDFRLYFHKK
ncbi:MAG: hypothetical protein NXI09_15575 [Bacteroidetes bacterium]|nr:hypothetical protein [Bacteroidota bacterium]